MSPNAGTQPATIVTLDAGIRNLTAAQDSLRAVPVKVAFESVISILSLVMVRVFLFVLSRPHLSVTRPGQDGGRRYICGTSPAVCQSVPRVENRGGRDRLG